MSELAQATAVVVMHVGQDHVLDVLKSHADGLELCVEQVRVADHGGGHAMAPELRFHARATAPIVGIQAGIEQYPPVGGIEQIGADRLTQNEPAAPSSGGEGLGQDLKATQQYEQAADEGRTALRTHEMTSGDFFVHSSVYFLCEKS